MDRIIVCICLFMLHQPVQHVASDPDIDIENLYFLNRTTPSERQTYDFKLEHPFPVGVLTTSSGLPVDVRDTVTTNTNEFKNQYFIDLQTHIANPRIPERVVHAKGTAAWGYFVVDNDVSKYTSADVFNRVGKITPAFARFSTGVQSLGGNDVSREQKSIALKLYTKEGNLDFLTLHIPVFFVKEAILFPSLITAVKRNVQTNRHDFTYFWDFITQRPESLHSFFWLISDYGIPNGYRKMDYFPIQTYELVNKHGERHFVRFSFRSLQGIELLTPEGVLEASRDPDYYNKDLYDAIEEKNYPVWKLEMDIMSQEDILRVDYDPFDVTRLWKKGTYITVPIGRVIMNQNPDNFFRDVELSALNPANLVPGIPGPVDSGFRARRLAYRDAHIHRLGINHNKILVNEPLYRKEYNRDGKPPVLENMKGAPIYYPNSFSGPQPYVDEARPKDSLSVVESKAVDLGQSAYFYHHILLTEPQRERFINNTVNMLLPVAPYMQHRVIKLYSLVSPSLGKRLTKRLWQAEQAPGTPPPEVVGWKGKNYEITHGKKYIDHEEL